MKHCVPQPGFLPQGCQSPAEGAREQLRNLTDLSALQKAELVPPILYVKSGDPRVPSLPSTLYFSLSSLKASFILAFVGSCRQRAM